MIYGTKNWEDPGIRYDQENNIVESFLERAYAGGIASFKLESCNVEAACCAIEAVGGNFTIQKPSWMGYGDLLFDFLNAPKNLDLLLDAGPRTPPNEVIENLARGIVHISDAKAIVLYCTEWANDKIERDMLTALKQNHSIVLSYRTDYGSGHYITIIGYDDETKEFIVNDPWKRNQHCKNNGLHERYSLTFFTARMRPRFMEVWA